MKDYIINGYEPECLFHFFEELSAIPRGSHNEAGVADALVSFAQARGLDCYRDELNNVLIKKPATPGYEDEPAMLIQGHTDMVCEKNSNVQHDFKTQPLDLYVEDGWLHARGTTLGADNGTAVALMLALLDGAADQCPALECLFTASEEVGLVGATGFDYSRISARRMINMDSDDEGMAVVGCAGGCRTDIKLPVEFVEAAGEALSIHISGLMGGHSGADITLGRANANKLMGRLLLSLRRDADYNLISLNGGLMDNAIPRECEAVITCSDSERMRARATIFAEKIRSELVADDAGFTLTCERVDKPEYMMNCASTRLVAEAVGTVENGVIRMSSEIPGLAEFSRNLGIIRTSNDVVELIFSSRSPKEHLIEASIDYLDAVSELCGASAEHYSRYPGWEYARQSPLRDKYIEVARRVLGREPQVVAIHAGLECGVIKSRLPDMDMISIGADAQNIHTPDERLDLASYGRLWRIVTEMLKK